MHSFAAFLMGVAAGSLYCLSLWHTSQWLRQISKLPFFHSLKGLLAISGLWTPAFLAIYGTKLLVDSLAALIFQPRIAFDIGSTIAVGSYISYLIWMLIRRDDDDHRKKKRKRLRLKVPQFQTLFQRRTLQPAEQPR